MSKTTGPAVRKSSLFCDIIKLTFISTGSL
uniref:Uncharacterized protein n=1 Tax=Anguilla anguilla TaxID=7936 RepID=A0A0E9UF25_ANGAN